MAVTAKLKCDLNDKPVQEGRQYDAKCEKVQPCGNIPDENSDHNHTPSGVLFLRPTVRPWEAVGEISSSKPERPV